MRQLQHRHRPAAGEHDEHVPTNPALAQQQADSLNGNALKSLREMSGPLTHLLWYFARVEDALPPRATASAAREQAHSYRFRYMGHRPARTR